MTNDVTEDMGREATTIVDFITKTSYDDIPEDVRNRSKLLLLDTLGSLLAASDSQYDPGRILSKFVETIGGHPDATLIGYGTKTSTVNAALANGTMGYFCDLDAHHPEAITHTPAIMVPTALAAGERESSTGKELLVSMIVGIEVASRVSLALNPGVLYEQGFHPTPVSGVFGAAATAGKMFNLSPDRLHIAMGLAQNQASGMLGWKEEPTESFRPFNPGIAARNGVTAAELARLEFGSPVDAFEGEYNIFRAFSQGEENVEELHRNLGERYTVMEHAFKKYSSVAFSHTCLDALIGLLKEHELDSTDLQEIVVRFPATGAELIDGTDLNSHSLGYLMAIGAIERRVTIEDIVDDRSAEPQVADLMEHTEIVPDESLDHLFPERYTSIVELTTDDGQYTERVDYAKGTPVDPFDRSDVEEKFRTITQSTTTEKTRAAIIETVDSIERVDEVSELVSLLH